MSKSGPESQPSPVAPEAERPEAERPESESQEAASNVAHETDSRRRHVRLSMPLQVTIDGKIYDVVDWSLSGMQVANVEGMPGVGSRFVADVAVPFSDFNFALKVSCEIVWFDLEKMRIGCRFIDLRESQISLLRYLVDAFVSGRIATVDGLLHTSGSAPGSRRGPEIPGIGDQEVSRVRRYWETAKRGSVYGLFLALGLAIAAFAGISIYNRLFAVTTDLGWVHATMVPVRATGEGMVEGVPPGPNTGIKRGAQLLQIESSSLQGELSLAVAALAKDEELLAGLRRQLTERQDFFVEYNELASVERKRAEARVSEAEVALDISRRQLARAKTLFGKGHLTASNLEQQEADFAAAELNLRLARADLDQSKRNAEVANQGYFYTGTRVEGGEPADIGRQVRLAEESVKIARTRVTALRAQQESLLIRSPCDCIVQDTYVVPGMWVERGDLLYQLALGQDQQTIKALVSQDAVGRIKIGGKAEVELADRDGLQLGRVTAIDRISDDQGSAGALNLVPNRHRFAQVTVVLSEKVGYIPTGLPARVDFPPDFSDWRSGLFEPSD